MGAFDSLDAAPRIAKRIIAPLTPLRRNDPRLLVTEVCECKGCVAPCVVSNSRVPFSQENYACIRFMDSSVAHSKIIESLMMEFALRHEVEQKGLTAAQLADEEASKQESRRQEVESSRRAVVQRAASHTVKVSRRRDDLRREKTDPVSRLTALPVSRARRLCSTPRLPV